MPSPRLVVCRQLDFVRYVRCCFRDQLDRRDPFVGCFGRAVPCRVVCRRRGLDRPQRKS